MESDDVGQLLIYCIFSASDIFLATVVENTLTIKAIDICVGLTCVEKGKDLVRKGFEESKGCRTSLDVGVKGQRACSQTVNDLTMQDKVERKPSSVYLAGWTVIGGLRSFDSGVLPDRPQDAEDNDVDCDHQQIHTIEENIQHISHLQPFLGDVPEPFPLLQEVADG